MLIKQFTIFHPFTCSLLCELSSMFEEVIVLKPEVSNPRNSEVYVFYRTYVMDPESFFKSSTYSLMSRLLKSCGENNKLPTQLKNPQLWSTTPEWMNALVQVQRKLVAIQMDALSMFESFASIELKNEIFKYMAQQMSHSFTRKYPVFPLDAKYWFSRLKAHGRKSKSQRKTRSHSSSFHVLENKKRKLVETFVQNKSRNNSDKSAQQIKKFKREQRQEKKFK